MGTVPFLAYRSLPGRVRTPFPSVEAPWFFADLMTPERSSWFSTSLTVEMEQEDCEAIIQLWSVNLHLPKLSNEPHSVPPAQR